MTSTYFYTAQSILERYISYSGYYTIKSSYSLQNQKPDWTVKNATCSKEFFIAYWVAGVIGLQVPDVGISPHLPLGSGHLISGG